MIRKAGESPETKENQKLLNSMEEYMREVTSEEVYEAEKIAEMLVPVAGEAAVGKIIGEEATATGNMVETVTKNVAAETRNLIESKPSVGENELEEGAGSGKILCRSKRTPGRDCIPIQEESSRSNRTAATTDGVVPNTVAAVDEGVVSKIVMLPSRIVSYFVNFINDAIEKTTGYESGGNLVPAEGSTIIREGFSQSAIRASGEQEPRGILTAKDGSQKVSGDVVRSGSTSTGEETSQVMHTTSPGIVLENEEEHQMVMRKKNSKRNRKKGTIKAITEETTVHDVRTPGGITEGDKIKETMDGSAPTGSSSLISPETTEVPHRDAALKNEKEYQMVMGGKNSKRNRKKGTVESITEKTTIHNVKTPGSITGGAVIHNARTPRGYARQFLKDHPDRDLKAMAKEIFGGEGDVAKDTQEYENAYHRPNHHKNIKVIKNLTINEGNGINYNVNLAPERLRHILERHHFVYFNRAYAMGKSAKSNLFAYGASPGDVVNTIEHLLKDNGDLIFAGKQSRSSRYFLDLQDTNRARYHIGFLQNSKDKVYVDQFYPLDTPEWEAVNAEIQSEIDHPISSSR
ncbi:hypothetical protein [Pasteuria penetrans]|uniref:hypothetical protein n=1 Tax=Pasteuria penetrans TaxID=86005 RepID=UPI000FAC628D|nr:hypothetical protein [Pasteuria penetrans]